jgi:hypothetical protein
MGLASRNNHRFFIRGVSNATKEIEEPFALTILMEGSRKGRRGRKMHAKKRSRVNRMGLHVTYTCVQQCSMHMHTVVLEQKLTCSAIGTCRRIRTRIE